MQQTLWRQQRRTLLGANGFSLWSQEIRMVSLKCPGEEGQLQKSAESMSSVECTVSVCLGWLWRADECHSDMWMRVPLAASWNLRSVLRRDDSLACSPGTRSLCGTGRAFTVFGRLRLSLRGAGIPNKLAQELEFGQEELPDYIPACKVRRDQNKCVYSPL